MRALGYTWVVTRDITRAFNGGRLPDMSAYRLLAESMGCLVLDGQRALAEQLPDGELLPDLMPPITQCSVSFVYEVLVRRGYNPQEIVAFGADVMALASAYEGKP